MIQQKYSHFTNRQKASVCRSLFERAFKACLKFIIVKPKAHLNIHEKLSNRNYMTYPIYLHPSSTLLKLSLNLATLPRCYCCPNHPVTRARIATEFYNKQTWSYYKQAIWCVSYSTVVMAACDQYAGCTRRETLYLCHYFDINLSYQQEISRKEILPFRITIPLDVYVAYYT